jgi:hypothetical protein
MCWLEYDRALVFAMPLVHAGPATASWHDPNPPLIAVEYG